MPCNHHRPVIRAPRRYADWSPEAGIHDSVSTWLLLKTKTALIILAGQDNPRWPKQSAMASTVGSGDPRVTSERETRYSLGRKIVIQLVGKPIRSKSGEIPCLLFPVQPRVLP